MVAFNKDCDKIAVANEGEGVYGDAGLVDPEGSVSIISLDNGGSSGTVQTVSFAPIATSDEDLKAKGVHLPLELKAQEYYDLHSAKFSGDLDFAASRAAHAQHAESVPRRRARLQPYLGYNHTARDHGACSEERSSCFKEPWAGRHAATRPAKGRPRFQSSEFMAFPPCRYTPATQLEPEYVSDAGHHSNQDTPPLHVG